MCAHLGFELKHRPYEKFLKKKKNNKTLLANSNIPLACPSLVLFCAGTGCCPFSYGQTPIILHSGLSQMYLLCKTSPDLQMQRFFPSSKFLQYSFHIPLQPLAPTYLFVSIYVYMSPLHFGETLVSVIPVWSIFVSPQDASDTDHLSKGRLSFKFVEEITLSSFLYYSLASPARLLIQRKRNASLCLPRICLRSGYKDGVQ